MINSCAAWFLCIKPLSISYVALRTNLKGVIDINTMLKKETPVKGERMQGLTPDKVERSRRENGRNILSPGKRKGFIRKFLENLGDPVVKILIGALIINVIFMFKRANWVETAGIAVSIFLATFISTLSEHGSEGAFDRLCREVGQSLCRVIRSGEVTEIDVGDVVVGDLLVVGAGEQIAADGVLVSGELQSDQSAMTGESREIKKRAHLRTDKDDFTPSSPYYCLRG